MNLRTLERYIPTRICSSTSKNVKLIYVFNENFCLYPAVRSGKVSVRESVKLNNFRKAHHRSEISSQTAPRQTHSTRNPPTKEGLVPRWILQHHLWHFPLNDSISTFLASHSVPIIISQTCFPPSYRWAVWEFPRALPWNPEVGRCFEAVLGL